MERGQQAGYLARLQVVIVKVLQMPLPVHVQAGVARGCHQVEALQYAAHLSMSAMHASIRASQSRLAYRVATTALQTLKLRCAWSAKCKCVTDRGELLVRVRAAQQDDIVEQVHEPLPDCFNLLNQPCW